MRELIFGLHEERTGEMLWQFTQIHVHCKRNFIETEHRYKAVIIMNIKTLKSLAFIYTMYEFKVIIVWSLFAFKLLSGCGVNYANIAKPCFADIQNQMMRSPTLARSLQFTPTPRTSFHWQ